mmetsp:Transcript_5777/g.12623  ORF Transcript_5777/g.12623 Transcript_5777/m.12623 type:complete len:773 (+) Transcript_5777:1-2319(+)
MTMTSSDAAATTTANDAAPAPQNPSCPPILRGIQSAVGPALFDRILNCRILLVGSGGIGCELLKNLALSGFRNVEIIDLDTIDVSNLNRQFLFRSHHVGMPKCVVASEAALRMVPPLESEGEDESAKLSPKYLPHHGNVCDNSKFNVPYVQKFALVLNALDNVAARRRVNRLCLAASVPLVEAGTAGYLGQVTVIDKASGTECYECQAKPTQKVYPICTIRSTPSQPVHCIVWAKELYKLCFGTKIEDSMLFEDEESLRADTEAAEKEKEKDGNKSEGFDDEGKKSNDFTDDGSGNNAAGGEKSTYMDIVNTLRSFLGIGSVSDKPQSEWESALRSKAQEALTALFVTEIQKQIGMDRYKTADKVPVPISLYDIANCTNTDILPPTVREEYAPTNIWSPADCISEIASCFVEVAANASPPNPTQPLPEFDKDDDMAMRFVTAASNLRSYVFSIEPLQSLYDAKGIAGNIIPAIATTNAIVAGLQVLQSFHILRAQLAKEEGTLKDMCRYIYCLRDKTRKGYLLQPTTLPEPNPNCFVCRNATISLSLNTKEWTLGMLLNRVIKKELGFAQPSIMIGEDSIVYEEGEDIDPSEYSTNLSKKLVNLPAGGLGHGSSIRVEDFTQDLEVDVSVSHKDHWVIVEKENGKKGEPKEDDREEIEKFEIGGKKPIVAEAAPGKDGTSAEAGSNANGDSVDAKADGADDSDDDDIEVIEADDVNSNGDSKMPAKDSVGSKAPTKKRPLEQPTACNDGAAKKIKLDDAKEKSDEIEVIELD